MNNFHRFQFFWQFPILFSTQALMITERRYALKIPAKLTRVSSATAYLRALARANFYVAVSCFAANFFDSAVRLTTVSIFQRLTF